MKAYQFSMERILQWREDEEKEVSGRWSLKNSEIHDKNKEIENLMIEYHQIKEAYPLFKNIAELIQMQTYKSILEENIERELGHLNRLNLELDEIHHALTQARKDKTVMEKLKERDLFRYHDQLKVDEQNALDEIAIAGHFRKERSAF